MKLIEFLKPYTLEIHFQPIVSVRSYKVSGYEALLRTYDKKGKFISPLSMFEMAKKVGLLFEFDRCVRSNSIKEFTTIHKDDPSLLLFLNFESSLIDNEQNLKRFRFEKVCKRYSMPSENIVLEIKEDSIQDTEHLWTFCSYFKSRGFLIALDDFGIGSSNFDRLSIVKPDIVKIDRSLIDHIDTNYINSEVFKAIVNMCHKIGAVVLSEGVERKEEILRCLKFDVDIFQGFWFAKANKEVNCNDTKVCSKLSQIQKLHEKMIQKHHKEREKLVKKVSKYAHDVENRLIKRSSCDIHNAQIKEFLNDHEAIEAIYLMTYKEGIQRGDTLICTEVKKFFEPAKDGDIHTLKEYYHRVKSSKQEYYLSPKYISKATGHMCRTFAKRIHLQSEDLILCLDILEE